MKKLQKLQDEYEALAQEINNVECPWAPKSEKKIEKLEAKQDKKHDAICNRIAEMDQEEYESSKFASAYGWNWEEIQEIYGNED